MNLRVKSEIEGIDPKRVRRARELAGLSQDELAEKIGCSKRAIQYWESNGGVTRRPHSKYVRRLAEATGKPIPFFYGEDPVAA